MIRTLAEPALAALARAGADIDTVRAAPAGRARACTARRRSMPRPWPAKGFTSHEIAAAEAALAAAASLARSLRPGGDRRGLRPRRARRPGRGAGRSEVRHPGLRRLRREDAVAEAEAHILGAPSLGGSGEPARVPESRARRAGRNRRRERAHRHGPGDRGPHLRAGRGGARRCRSTPARKRPWRPRRAAARGRPAGAAAGPRRGARQLRPRPRAPARRARPGAARRRSPDPSAWSSASSRWSARAGGCPTGARAISRKPPWAATRSICTRANMRTASSARSSSTCTRKARPSAP